MKILTLLVALLILTPGCFDAESVSTSQAKKNSRTVAGVANAMVCRIANDDACFLQFPAQVNSECVCFYKVFSDEGQEVLVPFGRGSDKLPSTNTDESLRIKSGMVWSN